MDRTWIIIALCVSSFCFSEAQRPTVKFSNVIVQGVVNKTRGGRDIESFMGIPYAEPPIEDLRFRDPVPKVYRDGSTLIADRPPTRCLQSLASKIGDESSPRVMKGHENCLYLNVHRPASIGNELLPVMVYFQAADLIPRTLDVSYIGPDYLLDGDYIILVTLTYRLGVFGFLSTGDEAAPGNFGLKDQKLALEWVQSNIAAFGGDPNRVTLFGHGEAAKLIHIHTLANHTAGLFNQYILQSGTALAPWTVHDWKNSLGWTKKLATLSKCLTLSSWIIVDCLRFMDARQLLELSYEPFSRFDIHFYKMWGPIKEPISPGAFLTECPEDLFARGAQRDLPFIAGVTVFENAYKSPVDWRDEDFIPKSLDHLHDVFNMTMGTSDSSERVAEFYLEEMKNEGIQFLVAVDYFFSDFSYYYPLVKMLEERKLNSKSPFYFYSFEYSGTFGMDNWRFLNHWSSNPTHGDDLLYLFRHETSNFPGGARHYMDGFDNLMVEIMVELWTSFAKNGVPRSSRGDNWGPYDSEGLYLTIGLNEQPSASLSSKFHEGRMRFWANITTLRDCD